MRQYNIIAQDQEPCLAGSWETPREAEDVLCWLHWIWEFPKMRGSACWGPYNKDPSV